MKSYTYIKTFNNENSGEDYKICNSIVAQTNGKYTLSFHLDNDGDGVIDTYTIFVISKLMLEVQTAHLGILRNLQMKRVNG